MADYVIIGAGIVGLAIAIEIKRRQPAASITLLEKESQPGLHASGRNSGVLHSGIYYPEGSLKARLCGQGAREMAQYCVERGLPIIRPGKLLVPVNKKDSSQLSLLQQRGAANGVDVRRLNQNELSRLEPEAGSATGEALFIPATAVVDPRAVLGSLVQDTIAAGIDIRCGGRLGAVDAERRELEWNEKRLGFGHAINSAGLYADRVAQLFGVGPRYMMLPFKGLYWQLSPGSGIRPRHLIYPVPDLRVPFLGIHTTSTVNGNIYVGPTAVPALSRENYRGLERLVPSETVEIAAQLFRMIVSGQEGFRSLAWQEGLRFLKPCFAAAARRLLPRLLQDDLIACDKVGIRAQLFDRSAGTLVNDFLVERGVSSTHVLNAVSPAFTSAFPLARYLCDCELRL